MSSMILLCGSNGSGKSRFAERLVAETTGKRYYIATMIAAIPENEPRIEKHRQQRKGLGFETLELPYFVGHAPVTPGSVVLLEDVSNLYANAFFDKGCGEESVFQDILRLKNRCGRLFAVTISGLTQGSYTGETLEYIQGLNRLNERLLREADAAAEMREGRPVWVKGGFHAIF